MVAQSPQQLILDALNKQRAEIYAHLKQMDKVIKQVKDGDFSGIGDAERLASARQDFAAHIATESNSINPKSYKGDIKIGVLKAFDTIGKACKLRALQDVYANLTGHNVNIRESVRALNRSKKVWLMKEIGAERGIYWVRSEWVEDGKLLEEFKPDGFDLLYDDANLEYV